MPIESTHAIEHHLRLRADAAIHEVSRALSQHEPYNSFHEAHAILREEFDELWDEIKVRDQDYMKIYTESIQVAAVALRIAVCAHRKLNGGAKS